MYLLLGVIHYCPSTSISLFMAISTVAKRCGRELPGCNANIQVWLLKKNMKGYPRAILVQSKKLVAFSAVLLLCPATKSGGVLCYTLETFECLSVRLSVRPSVCPSVRQRLIIRVRSITLIPFEIISRNLAQI